jgi:hypothetical protein
MVISNGRMFNPDFKRLDFAAMVCSPVDVNWSKTFLLTLIINWVHIFKESQLDRYIVKVV